MIYIDETMITKSTVPTHEYSVKKDNVKIDMKSLNRETVAVLAGVSLEVGIDLVMTFPSSINIASRLTSKS